MVYAQPSETKKMTMAAIEPEQAALYGLFINKSNGIYNHGVELLDLVKVVQIPSNEIQVASQVL
jgi:hypothetical protein